MKRDRRYYMLGLSCPNCEAGPGKSCIDDWGRARWYHQSRAAKSLDLLGRTTALAVGWTDPDSAWEYVLVHGYGAAQVKRDQETLL